MDNKVEAFVLLLVAMALIYVGQQLFAQAKQTLLS
jgi:hypothetical protein